VGRPDTGARRGAEPTSIGVTPDGSQVLVGGNTIGRRGRTRLIIVAYAADTGSLSWSRTFARPGLEAYAADMFVPRSGSSVLVAGTMFGDDRGSSYLTVSYAIA
jgi:hypothetical protein